MQAQGWVINNTIARFEIGPYRNFVYLVLDWPRKKAAVVDPQADLKPLLAGFAEYGFDLESILITHSHADHVAGVPELMKRYPPVPVFIHELEMPRLHGFISKKSVLRAISDQESIRVGSLTLTVLHTPGHSSGECSFFLDGDPPYLFSGDTIFIRDCGRTDLPTGSTAQMFESLQRLKKLPPHTVILPGHHYAPESTTTLERELKESLPFLCQTVEELEALP